MNSRRTQTSDSERQIESEPLPPDPAAQRRRAGLEAATREELVSLVERMASSSEEMAARIDYLTDPNAAAKDLQRRIRAIRNGTRFIAYGETRGFAAEIATIAEDIRKDVLPRGPGEGGGARREALWPRSGDIRAGGRLERRHWL